MVIQTRAATTIPILLFLAALLLSGCATATPGGPSPVVVPAPVSYVIIGDSVASTGGQWAIVQAAFPTATFRNVGVGSTYLHSNWQPGGSAFEAMHAAVTTRPTAFLMHAGANDTILQPAPTQASVFADLARIAAALQRDYPGSLLYLADVGQVWTYGDKRAENAQVRAGITEAWAELPGVRQGPQMGDLTPDDGVHFTSVANTQTIADRWTAILQAGR